MITTLHFLSRLITLHYFKKWDITDEQKLRTCPLCSDDLQKTEMADDPWPRGKSLRQGSTSQQKRSKETADDCLATLFHRFADAEEMQNKCKKEIWERTTKSSKTDRTRIHWRQHNIDQNKLLHNEVHSCSSHHTLHKFNLETVQTRFLDESHPWIPFS